MPTGNGAGTGTMTRDQIRTVASQAGFSGTDLEIAVAVALAESSGNPRAHNSTPPDDSYGLWQINMLGSLGPDRRKKFGISSNDALYDPATNAKAAKIIHAGSGWKAWTTYTRGTYKKYMGETAATGTTTEASETTVDDSWAGKIKAGLDAVGKNIFNSIANFVGITTALTLLILGIVLLARNAIPVGKLAKVGKQVIK